MLPSLTNYTNLYIKQTNTSFCVFFNWFLLWLLLLLRGSNISCCFFLLSSNQITLSNCRKQNGKIDTSLSLISVFPLNPMNKISVSEPKLSTPKNESTQQSWEWLIQVACWLSLVVYYLTISISTELDSMIWVGYG